MIKLNNVDFSYGKTEVLKDFSLEINPSDRICLFGESGSGKTTILRLILDLETPQKGEIQKAIIPIEKLLECYPALKVTDNQAVRFKNGGDLMSERVKGLKAFGLYRVYGMNTFLGIGEYSEGSESLKVKRVYNEL